MLLVKSSLIIPVFQSWPDSEAQQQSWSLECSQRRINGVSGYTRLHQLRPRMIFSSAVLPTTFTAPLPWKQLLPYFPDFCYLLSRYSHLPFHLSPPFHPFWSPPNVFQSTMETPTHSCTPTFLFSKANYNISRFTDLTLDKCCHSRQNGEWKTEHMDAGNTEELEMATSLWKARILL